jgi:hypothetical protein
MTFDDILAQVLELLQREGRVSYRALKVRFQLDDDLLEAVKDELIYAKKLAVDEDNRVLVWTGDQDTSPPPPVLSTPESASAPAPDHAREPLSYTPKHLAEKILTSRRLSEKASVEWLRVAHGSMQGDNNASLCASLWSTRYTETADERCPWENIPALGPRALPACGS